MKNIFAAFVLIILTGSLRAEYFRPVEDEESTTSNPYAPKPVPSPALKQALWHPEEPMPSDLISVSLINHVSTNFQWTTDGNNRVSLASSILGVGKIKESQIGQLRFSVTALTNPNVGEDFGAGYVGDLFLNVAPIVREYVILNPDWTFLNALEFGPSYAYDFREHHAYLNLNFGLAFSLNPLQ